MMQVHGSQAKTDQGQNEGQAAKNASGGKVNILMLSLHLLSFALLMLDLNYSVVWSCNARYDYQAS